MVDYFVKSVKAQTQDFWLYFPCKQGIGITGSFMIMYDMMKNYMNVSADDIIKRQLALVNYNENTLKFFYNNERISFLKCFYDYCKVNGYSFYIKWSEWKNVLSKNL